MPTSSQRSSTPSGPLQSSFQAFRQKKLAAARANGAPPAAVGKGELPKRTKDFRDKLRAKFLETALSYQGVPYSKRYHKEPSCSHYNAPLYLDCCGLVRKSVKDLAEEFGFQIGRFNQSYQLDTLPKVITEAEMRPGDLVFVEAEWYDKNRKKQTANMQHVEIWMGDGEKTLGARMSHGVVEIHDSYRYTGKKYGPNKYHFRSIDTWLNGVCKSHNKKKAWPNPGRQIASNAKSVFAR